MIWIKNHLTPFYLWLSGFTWTMVIDWEHILSRIVETSILAFFNGILAAAGGGVFIWISKRVKKRIQELKFKSQQNESIGK